MEGLDEQEVRQRQSEFGPNVIQKVRRFTILRMASAQFMNFFAVILWVSAGLAFAAEFFHPGQGMLTLGFAIVLVILVNGVFATWQEFRAERALTALKELMPEEVKCVRGGKKVPVRASTLVPGDIVKISAGDRVPADCRLVATDGLLLSFAALTGEALPVPLSSDPDLESSRYPRNVAPAGTTVEAGEGLALVIATGMHTEFGKVAHLAQTSGEVASPLQREIIRLTRRIAILAISIGVVFFLVGQWSGLSPWFTLVFAIGIIVANVPEGLLPTVTLSLAMATERMARSRALVRRLASVEALGATTVICTDKTGTLTLNQMRVVQLYFGGQWVSANELGSEDRVKIAPVLNIALRCNQLAEVRERGKGRTVGDPIEKALREFAERFSADEAKKCRRIGAIPFSSKRRMLSVACEDPHGRVFLYCKGAPESVLPLCDTRWEVGAVAPLTKSGREDILDNVETAARKGARVLALAFREISGAGAKTAVNPGWERGLIFAGLVGIEDPPRPEVPMALTKCRDAGIRVIMITGDHPLTATAIGRQIGLYSRDPVVITGEHLSVLSKPQLQLALRAPEILFARIAPEQKLQVVQVLKKRGEVVAMTGDGVNDAPALRAADVGIAMGESGTDVARESSDLILLDDNFATIVLAIEEGRAVYENIRRFLTYILTSNIPELVPYLAFVLFRIPLPLTVPQILAVDLGTDIVPALGLGVERADPEIMRRPPRARGERLLNWPTLARAYLFLGMFEAAAAMAAYFFVMSQGSGAFAEESLQFSPLVRQAQTACFSAIIVMQTINVFLCKTTGKTVRRSSLFDNRLILVGIFLEWLLVLIIVYTPIGNALFGTQPIPLSAWLVVIPFAFGMVIAEELRRRIALRNPHIAGGVPPVRRENR